MTDIIRNDLLKLMREGVEAAVPEIIRIQQSGDMGTQEKEDKSKVTLGDSTAQAIYVEAYNKALGENKIYYLNEEDMGAAVEANEARKDTASYRVAFDPIDGTGNYAKGFTRSIDELTADAGERLLAIGDWLSTDLKRYLPCAVRASRAGVGRVHLIGYNEDGTLLRELFSRDGVGTIITRESLEKLRDARPDDISGLVALIEPLEEDGTLVRRSRELLEREITRFSVVEHDGMIVGCAALYPYGEDQAELACLAVHPQYRRWGYGEKLMKRIEVRARAAHIKRLFVLTTITGHWFKERGFVVRPVDELPAEKRLLYNLQRRSKVLMKPL